MLLHCLKPSPNSSQLHDVFSPHRTQESKTFFLKNNHNSTSQKSRNKRKCYYPASVPSQKIGMGWDWGHFPLFLDIWEVELWQNTILSLVTLQHPTPWWLQFWQNIQHVTEHSYAINSSHWETEYLQQQPITTDVDVIVKLFLYTQITVYYLMFVNPNLANWAWD